MLATRMRVHYLTLGEMVLTNRMREAIHDSGVRCPTVAPCRSPGTVCELQHGAERRSCAVLLPRVLGQHSTLVRSVLPLLWGSIRVRLRAPVQPGSCVRRMS